MVIQVNILIYAYMILCVCMLAFNLAYIGREKWYQQNSSVKKKKYQDKIIKLLNNGTDKLDAKAEKDWFRQLKKCSRLILFEQALETLRKDENYQYKIKEWTRNNKNLFLKLSTVYLNKKGMEKAFYAYVVEKNELCGESYDDPFALQMIKLATDHSIYCRENALNALYASGISTHIIKAYHVLTRRNIEHSAKMVVDGLLMYKGNQEDLAEELWENWHHFSTYYQVCFINYIRMISANFGDRFLSILKDPKKDRELHFAVIRYYRKYKFDPALEVLCYLVENWKNLDWEYAALSALSLEQYPEEKSEKALRSGCVSRSWYVRYNCAQSLAKIIDAERRKTIIDTQKDLFAKEMLEYKFFTQERED